VNKFFSLEEKVSLISSSSFFSSSTIVSSLYEFSNIKTISVPDMSILI